jgi:predicted nucleic acid-binding protein
LHAADVLARFDALALLEPEAPKAPVTCKDADDQKFIDLAAAHQSLLLSKDQAVLCMSKRLLALAVIVSTAIK